MSWAVVAAALAAPPSLDAPVRSGSAAQADSAVVVGVEDYAFLPDVPYARRDADAMADVLVHTVGIPSDRVFRLDGGNRDQILRAVDAAAATGAERVWVYFAGHGATASDGGLLLVGDDAKRDPRVFEERSLAVDDLAARLPEGTVLLLDTCYAGSDRSGGELLPGARFAVPSYATSGEGRHVWTAASPSEISGPYEPAQHGLFTYFVVGAIRGWADGELEGQPDGQVTLAEARAFVGRALASISTRGQTPVLSATRPENVVLSAGRLEDAPDLATFPDTDGVVRAATPTTPTPRPDPVTPLPTPTPVPGFTITPPLQHVGGKRFVNGNGVPIPLWDIERAIERDALGSRALRQQRTGRDLTLAGGITSFFAADLALVAGIMTLVIDDQDVTPTFLKASPVLGAAGVGLLVPGVVLTKRGRRGAATAYNNLAQRP